MNASRLIAAPAMPERLRPARLAPRYSSVVKTRPSRGPAFSLALAACACALASVSAGQRAGSVEDSIRRATLSAEKVRASTAGSIESKKDAAALLVEDGAWRDAPAGAPSARWDRPESALPSLSVSPASWRSTPFEPPAAAPAAPASVELGARFLEIHGLLRSGRVLPLSAEARSARYLLVPGFLSSHMQDYFGATLRGLTRLGLDARLVRIDTDGDREGNLKVIERLVAQSPVPVVLLGHSRGGNLIHDWYRTAPAALKAKIARLVLLQAPLAGSPVADWMLESSWLDRLARLADWLPGVGDVRGTLDELSTARRAQVLAALPPLSAADLDKTYTIVTAFDAPVPTSAGDGAFHRDLDFFRKIIAERTRQRSDGLVPVSSARLPGAKSLFLEGLDHEDTVLQEPGWFKRLTGSGPRPDYAVEEVSRAIVSVLFPPRA